MSSHALHLSIIGNGSKHFLNILANEGKTALIFEAKLKNKSIFIQKIKFFVELFDSIAYNFIRKNCDSIIRL